ncbi:hypothetical protein IZT14_002213 [Clostridium perfringens]
MTNHAIDGFNNEIYFVKFQNKNKTLNNPIWSFIINDLNLNYNIENLFLIRVSNKVFSKIHNYKINAKADVYLASGNIPEEKLLELDYYLDEDSLKKFNLKPIHNSGISLKKDTSSKFQIMKISPEPFKKLIGNFELGAGASIFCKKADEIIKNDAVILGWHTTMQKFKDYFKNIEGIECIDNENENIIKRLGILKKIKQYSNSKIEQIVSESDSISKAIFMGIGIFDEPYTAHYLLSHGKFGINDKYPFTVTTGSGRSKGKYQLEFKPK